MKVPHHGFRQRCTSRLLHTSFLSENITWAKLESCYLFGWKQKRQQFLGLLHLCCVCATRCFETLSCLAFNLPKSAFLCYNFIKCILHARRPWDPKSLKKLRMVQKLWIYLKPTELYTLYLNKTDGTEKIMSKGSIHAITVYVTVVIM